MNVLNGQGFVELVDAKGDDKTIVNAARVSYDGDHDTDMTSRDRKLLAYLLDNMHTSPFEHVVVTVHVKAPIFVARQWMRHRTWSFNEMSARYTQVPDDDFYSPVEWRGQSTHNKQMSDGVVASDRVDELYAWSVRHAVEAYVQLIDAGVSREMARMVLPQSMFTRFYGTVDVHNLLHFVRLRAHVHAQVEIREYARALFGLLVGVVPVTAGLFAERHVDLGLNA